METSIWKQAMGYLKEQRKNKRWHKVLICLAVIVAAGTVALLTMPGQAQTHTRKVLDCPVEVHQHTDSCQDAEGNLVCGQVDFVVHIHNDDCYADGELVCPLPEYRIHEHTDACYAVESVLVCGLEEGMVSASGEEAASGTEGTPDDPIAPGEGTDVSAGDAAPEQEEPEPHVHTAECYEEVKVLVCEELGFHIHDEDCWDEDGNLICEQAQVHAHDETCYDTEGNLICRLPEILEHVHGENCFHVEELSEEEVAHLNDQNEETEETSQDESAESESAQDEIDQDEGIQEETIQDETDQDETSSEEDLTEAPEVSGGDLADETDEAADGRDETESGQDAEDGRKEAADGRDEMEDGRDAAEEGRDGAESGQDAEDSRDETAGGREMESAEEDLTEDMEVSGGDLVTAVFEDSKVRITATYGPEANLPEEAELYAYEVTPEAERYESRVQEALSVLEETGNEEAVAADKNLPEEMAAQENADAQENSDSQESQDAREAESREESSRSVEYQIVIYNIGFYVDGVEVEPEAPVNVTIQFLDENGMVIREGVSVLHFAEKEEKTEIEVLDGTAETGENAVNFDVGSFSDLAVAIANTVDWDLNNFLKQFEIKDGKGQVISPGGTLYVGEDYQITLSFGENSDGSLQFGKDANGSLTYTFPEGFLVRESQGTGSIPNVKGSEYEYKVEDGKLIVTFKDPNFVNTLQNLKFDITLNATLEADEDGKIEIPLDNDTSLEYKVEGNPLPSVEKRAGLYNPVEKAVDYEVEISAEQGAANGFVFSDTLTKSADGNSVLEYADPLTVTVDVYDKEGNCTQKTVTVHPTEDGTKFSLEEDQLPDLHIGERMVVKYSAKVRESAFGENGIIDQTQENTVQVTKPEKPEINIESKADVDIQSNPFEKKGERKTRDGIDMFRWMVKIGDGNPENTNQFLGATITDTLGDGLSVYTVGEEAEGLVIRIYNADDPAAENDGRYLRYVIPWENVTFSADRKVMSYALPDKNTLLQYLKNTKQITDDNEFPEHFYFKAVYYTTYEVPAGHSKYTFTNTVKTTVNGKPFEGTGTVEGVGPGNTVKTVANPDTVKEDGYIEFEVRVENIPAFEQGYTPFRFEDKLRFKNMYGINDNDWFVSVEQMYDLSVSLQIGEGDLTPLGSYVGEGTPNGYLLRVNDGTKDNNGDLKTEHGRFYLVFNTTNKNAYKYAFEATKEEDKCKKGDSGSTYLLIDQTSVLVVKYKVPLSAVVYDGEKLGAKEVGTLGGLLEDGEKLTNIAIPKIDGVEKRGDAEYEYPKILENTVKNGTQITENGQDYIEYRVEFKAWSEVGDPSTLLFDDISGLVFKDTFDNKYFDYVDGSLRIEVRKPTPEKDGSYKLRAAYQYVGDPYDASTGTITAPAENFTQRCLIPGEPNWGYDFYGTWSLDRKDLVKDYKNKVIERDTCNYFIFVYRLKPNKAFEDYLGSDCIVNNHASIEKDDEQLGEDDFQIDYKTGMMDKTAEVVKEPDGKGGELLTNRIEFTITLNPNGKKLIPDNSTDKSLTLTDEMSENLSLLPRTVKVMAGGKDLTKEGDPLVIVSWDEETKTMKLTNLPDETPIEITYEAKVTGALNDKATVSNRAYLENLDGYETELDREFEVNSSYSQASGSLGNIELIKVDENDLSGSSLQGAVFALYMLPANKGGGKPVTTQVESPSGCAESREFVVNDGNEKETGYFAGEYTTDSTGHVEIESQYLLGDGFSYVLVEIKAPIGYVLPTGEDALTKFYYCDNPDKVEYENRNNWKVYTPGMGITIKNYSDIYALPETGGAGSDLYTMVGIGLVLTAGLLYRKKLRERRFGTSRN